LHRMILFGQIVDQLLPRLHSWACTGRTPESTSAPAP
jgi:hypothetical protein